MKMAGNAQGSFGIPPQIAEAGERARANARQNVKTAGEEKPEDEGKERKPEVEEDVPTQEDIQKVAKVVENSNPVAALKTLGIEFNDEVLQNLIFKGFVEKTIEIVPGKLTAKLKTLTVEDHDLIDEMMAKESGEIKMTGAGYENRRSMLILCFAASELAGRIIHKPVLNKDKTIDVVETVKKRREALKKMNPGVVNIMIQKHSAMSISLNMIAAEPGAYLKNS